MPRIDPDVNLDPVYFDDGCETIGFGWGSCDVGQTISDADSVTHSYTSRAGDWNENRGSRDCR